MISNLQFKLDDRSFHDMKEIMKKERIAFGQAVTAEYILRTELLISMCMGRQAILIRTQVDGNTHNVWTDAPDEMLSLFYSIAEMYGYDATKNCAYITAESPKEDRPNPNEVLTALSSFLADLAVRNMGNPAFPMSSLTQLVVSGGQHSEEGKAIADLATSLIPNVVELQKKRTEGKEDTIIAFTILVTDNVSPIDIITKAKAAGAIGEENIPVLEKMALDAEAEQVVIAVAYQFGSKSKTTSVDLGPELTPMFYDHAKNTHGYIKGQNSVVIECKGRGVDIDLEEFSYKLKLGIRLFMTNGLQAE